MYIDIFNTEKKYNIIYADPPWSYQNWCDKKNGAAKAHYETMSQTDIEALPIGKLAEENCILFMWATFPKIQEALNTMKAWGFEYKTIGFCWVKRNKNGTRLFAGFRELFPEEFKELRHDEEVLGFTLDNKKNLDDFVGEAESCVCWDDQAAIHSILTGEFDADDIYTKNWTYPVGAFHGADGGSC